MGTTIDQESQEGQAEQPVKKADTNKPAKNLYEPYSTPRIIWEIIRYSARFIFFLTMHIRLRGRNNLPRTGPYIIAANHLSWLDIPLIPAFVPGKVAYMTKEEVFQSKIGWLARFLGAFPVKRGEGDRQALRAADEQLKKQKVVIIFPEGTRSKTHTMAKGHPGVGMIALRAGVPVVPVAIWGSENGLKRLRASVIISYGEPFVLKAKGSKITREDIVEGTDEIMRHIAALLPPAYRGVYSEQEQSTS